MSRLLIVYGTTEGQTRKIAEFIAAKARGAGHVVEIHDATAVPAGLNPEGFDHVIVAASLHHEQHQAPVDFFVRKNLLPLQNVHTAFLSVSLSAAGDESDHHDALACANRFLMELRWQPSRTVLVAGALRFTEYDFFKRWALKQIARQKGAPTDTSSDYEFTNWSELERFTSEFLGQAG